MTTRLEDILTPSELRDPYGGGAATAGVASVSLIKGLGGLDNRVAYGVFDTLAEYLDIIQYALYDPIMQIGGIGSGVGTALAKKGKQRTISSFVLFGTVGYEVYRYAQTAGISISYLATEPFFFGALSYAVVPTLALYAAGFVGGQIYRLIRKIFRRKKK